MDYIKLFFSFFGRIGRTIYWGGWGCNIMAVLTVFFVIDSIVLKSGGGPDAKAIEKWLLNMATIVSVVSVLSLHVRRMHDRGLSGWLGVLGIGAIGMCAWLINRLVPIILHETAYGLLLASPALAVLAFTLFQFGIVRGAIGSNAYGPDPREEEAKAANSATARG